MTRTMLCVSLLAAALLGCGGGPLLMIPGGELRGVVVEKPIRDWSFATDSTVDLETRPEDPYSVEINYTVRGGELFIDPTEGRRWLDNIREDPRVRVRFGNKVYPARAVLVGRPGEVEGFPSDRFVFRIESRSR